MKTLKVLLIVWSLVAAVASAAAVWDTKPYSEWSDKDVEKLLTESPWAGKATITHEREGANLGPIDLKLTVIVRSAEPVRRAIAHQQLAAGVPASPDLEANLAKPYPRFAFAIPKIPEFYRMQLRKTAQGSVLRVKGQGMMAVSGAVQLIDRDGKEGEREPARRQARRPQASEGAVILPIAQRGGGVGRFGDGGFVGGFKDDVTTATLILEYPKVEGITAGDGDIEISMVLGGYKIRKAFKLKDMMFKGALTF